MWNPDVPLEKWLKMFPVLNMALPYQCSCGKQLDAKPYVSSEWIGLESTKCNCELGESFCSGFPKNKEENEQASKGLMELDRITHGD